MKHITLGIFAMVTVFMIMPMVAKDGASPATHRVAKKCEESTPLKLACRLANYGKYQNNALAHIRDMGLKYVFMSIPKPEEVAVVMTQLREYGLEPLVVRGDVNLSLENVIDELRIQLETCKRMGVRYMFLSPKRHETPVEIIYERLRRAGDAAADYGVILVLETHPDLGTNGRRHVETMKAIHHPNVRVNFDTANITYYNNGTSAPAELEKCIDYVATLEVKDHSGEFETWNFPALGDGIVDFPSIFAILRRHGYLGPVTIEVEGIKGVEWSEEEIHKALEKSVNYLRSIECFE